jgi:hypothetical protein
MLVHCTGLWCLSIELAFLDAVSVWVRVNLKLELKFKLLLTLQFFPPFLPLIRYVSYLLDREGLSIMQQ